MPSPLTEAHRDTSPADKLVRDRAPETRARSRLHRFKAWSVGLGGRAVVFSIVVLGVGALAAATLNAFLEFQAGEYGHVDATARSIVEEMSTGDWEAAHARGTQRFSAAVSPTDMKNALGSIIPGEGCSYRVDDHQRVDLPTATVVLTGVVLCPDGAHAMTMSLLETGGADQLAGYRF